MSDIEYFDEHIEVKTIESKIKFNNCFKCPYYISTVEQATKFNNRQKQKTFSIKLYSMIDKNGNDVGYSFCTRTNTICHKTNGCDEKILTRILNNMVVNKY